MNYNPSVKAQESAAELMQLTVLFPEIPEMVITEDEWYEFQQGELERVQEEDGDMAESEEWPVDEYGVPYRS